MTYAPGRAFLRNPMCCITPNVPKATPPVDRRRFLAGTAAVLGSIAAPVVLGVSGALSQANPNRIDVHHHIVPPTWLAAMDLIGRSNPPLTHWSIQKTLDDMDKGGVGTSIVSPTTPQVTPLGVEAAVRIARESNEYGKKLMTDHPGRFGVFATLPLPHIDESLKEIAYAFDTLKVDGVGIMTNYGDKWLGYAYFAPVWEELNRRKAAVYTHPTDANCCVNLVKGVPPSALEWGTDTTRSIINLIFSGTSQKYKDINWIWSHGGGALSSVAERLLVQMVSTPPYKSKFTREQVQAELNRFYYDTAQVSLLGTLAALAKLVPVSQIVYGTDFPYRTAADHTKGVTSVFRGDDLKAVDRDNALRIIPRLKTG
jgi:predicted TIM-barrel fold metal-dependent hydrolase